MVNVDRLRKKHQELQEKNSGERDERYFLVKEKKSESDKPQVIRVLPGKEKEDEFFEEYATHKVGEKYYNCPGKVGEPCPICDAYYKIWEKFNTKKKNTGEEDDSLSKLAKSIKPRGRYMLNVIDREDGKVKLLPCGMKLFNRILNVTFDEDYGSNKDLIKAAGMDPDDEAILTCSLEYGWDFKVIAQQVDGYRNYDESAPRPQPSKAGTKKEMASWMESLHDLKGEIKYEEYDELRKVAAVILAKLEGADPEKEGSGEGYLSHLENLE